MSESGRVPSYLALSLVARIDPERREEIEVEISKVLGCSGIWLDDSPLEEGGCPIISFASTAGTDAARLIDWTNGVSESARVPSGS